ncbi:hypothetical protein SeMB42_g05722 [Synchytrium endobioticum]|uniref:Inner centromere protein ARK-binding domain-containing protein n=1 Tax=Synchytrium endobioticum TaxID=286115 RepID=A0A507D753_9FUNG|nr:hypothetical protein SeMB42_g05722 [Synchytrium endobioticum]TPX47157.1 hypothetical protein SeLEV6574_g02825 [Synchytrium endobioticum]
MLTASAPVFSCKAILHEAIARFEAECEAHSAWLLTFARTLLADASASAEQGKRKRSLLPGPDSAELQVEVNGKEERIRDGDLEESSQPKKRRITNNDENHCSKEASNDIVDGASDVEGLEPVKDHDVVRNKKLPMDLIEETIPLRETDLAASSTDVSKTDKAHRKKSSMKLSAKTIPLELIHLTGARTDDSTVEEGRHVTQVKTSSIEFIEKMIPLVELNVSASSSDDSTGEKDGSVALKKSSIKVIEETIPIKETGESASGITNSTVEKGGNVTRMKSSIKVIGETIPARETDESGAGCSDLGNGLLQTSSIEGNDTMSSPTPTQGNEISQQSPPREPQKTVRMDLASAIAATATSVPSPRQVFNDDPRLKSIMSTSIENLKKGLTSLNEKRKTALTSAAGQLLKTPAKISKVGNSIETTSTAEEEGDNLGQIDETSDMDVDLDDRSQISRNVIDGELSEAAETLKRDKAPKLTEASAGQAESDLVPTVFEEPALRDEEDPATVKGAEGDDKVIVVMDSILPLPTKHEKAKNIPAKIRNKGQLEVDLSTTKHTRQTIATTPAPVTLSLTKLGGGSTLKRPIKKPVRTDERIERVQQRRMEEEAKRAEEAKRREEDKARRAAEMSTKKDDEKKKQKHIDKQPGHKPFDKSKAKATAAKTPATDKHAPRESVKPLEAESFKATEVQNTKGFNQRHDTDEDLAPVKLAVKPTVLPSAKIQRIKVDSVGSNGSLPGPRTNIPVPEPVPANGSSNDNPRNTGFKTPIAPKTSILKTPVTTAKSGLETPAAPLYPPILNPIFDIEGMTCANTAVNATLGTASATIKAVSVKRVDSGQIKTKSGPTTIVDDKGDLPDIPSDDEESEDQDFEEDVRNSTSNAKGPVPSWAETPNLLDALKDQQVRDPDKIFGSVRPIQLEEVFRGVKDTRKFRPRTSSANWVGVDELTAQEELSYKHKMGFVE